ncbi:MAG TPA: fasciclin domain-containing protein [Pyrinomonadaceae bacterium]|nr:fasciclin domain-containing protein [Pyrinomonadaceae bacterium]
MKKIFFAFFALVLTLGISSVETSAQYKSAKSKKDIVDTAVATDSLSTLVAAVKAAGLVDTLKGAGPFTVFAPANDAFAALPAGTVDSLLLPENKAALTKVLTYHVVAGKIAAKDVAAAIKAGNGRAELTTVQGGKLVAMIEGSDVVLMDENGGRSKVTAVDVMTSNGVVHLIDSVVMPK